MRPPELRVAPAALTFLPLGEDAGEAAAFFSGYGAVALTYYRYE